jgi:type VI secretion system protein ImpM
MPEATLITGLQNAVPGWFGKLPHLGDFASRRLPNDFVRRWDRWLQRSLASAREQLGTRWLDSYLVAPIVRFWLRPGLAGERAWAGLMMPSVDRVGRHFPLTIAWPLEPLSVVLAARSTFAALDAAARRVLDVEFTPDDLDAALQAVARDSAPPDAASQQRAQRLLEALPSRTPGSLWWCADADDAPQFRDFDALPPAPAFVGLLGAAR